MQVNFILPLSPTANHHILRKGNMYFPSPEYKSFLKEVKYKLVGFPKLEDQLIEMRVGIHFKDNRKQDLDNRLKCLNDSLVRSGIMNDDRQIWRITVERLENANPPYMEIELKTFS